MWGIAGVAGPLLGGFLTDYVSWHWCFFINLPIGVIAIGFVLARMPKLGGGVNHKLDVGGALALAVGVVPLLIALTLGSRPGAGEGGVGTPMAWTHPTILLLFAAAAIGVIAFIVIELRVTEPLLDLRLFAQPTFRLGTLAMFAVGAAFFTAVVFIPLFLMLVSHVSATKTGLAMTPMTLGIVSGNILSGQLVTRLGRYKGLLVVALAAQIGALVLVATTIDHTTTAGALTVRLALVGLALGPSVPVFTLAIQNAAAPQQVGVVTAAATFARQIGGTIGTAVLMTVFATVVGARLGAQVAPAAAVTAGIKGVFLTGAGFAGLALLLTLAIPELPLRKTNR